MLVVVCLLLVGGSLAAYSLFWITSNTVHVDIRCTVVLSFSASDSDVSFNAVVRNNGRPAGAGINVDFYYSLNNGNWTHFATHPTNRGGVANARYTVTANGGYDFKAVASIP